MATKIDMPRAARERVIDLIERYNRFAAERAKEAERRANTLTTKLGTFWPQFNDARVAYAEHERTEPARFNLVRLLNLEGLESTHSRILADLLDPRGTHGQGTLFLEHFFDFIDLAEMKGKLTTPVEVRSELPITGDSRPDILVRCIPSFLVLIENKIRSGEGRAPDGKWQLEKYREWLDKQTAHKKVLVFLTIHGEKARSSAKPLCLSYTRHIRTWLQRCIESVTAAPVRYVLQQYLAVINDLRTLRRENANGIS